MPKSQVNTHEGARLRGLRALAALSLETVAERSGVVDLSRLSRAERDLANLSGEQIAAIEKALLAEIRARQRRAAAALGQRRDGREKDRTVAVA